MTFSDGCIFLYLCLHFFTIVLYCNCSIWTVYLKRLKQSKVTRRGRPISWLYLCLYFCDILWLYLYCVCTVYVLYSYDKVRWPDEAGPSVGWRHFSAHQSCGVLCLAFVDNISHRFYVLALTLFWLWNITVIISCLNEHICECTMYQS